MTTPTDNLVRACGGPDMIAMRGADSGSDGRTVFGHFSVFNTWTEINSRYEGRFLERVAPGAFKQAFKDTRNIRVLFDHGADPSIGNKPIANPTVMREDDHGAYFEAELFDAGYVNELVPALRAGQLGSSFRFSIPEGGQDWVQPTRSTDHNPDRLPERTVRNVRLYEFGPVPWGAYPDATSGVRSGTDGFIEHLLDDPRFVARLTERAGLAVVEKILASLPADGQRSAPASNESTDGDAEQAARLAVQRARAALLA